jgi:hypothetical protein
MNDLNQSTSNIEVSKLILGRLTEVATRVEDVAAGQSSMREEMRLSFNDGKHRMDGMDNRIKILEQEKAEKNARAEAGDGSDWSRPAVKHRKRDESQVSTDVIRRKLDLALWVKYGAMIGAVLAGFYLAIKAAGAPTP